MRRRPARSLSAALTAALALTIPAVPAAAAPDDTPYEVDSLADDADSASPDGTCEVAVGDATVCTLREALREANDGDGATITVAPAVAGGTIVLDPELGGLSITQPTVIDGGGTTIDGSALLDEGGDDLSVLDVRAFPTTIRDLAIIGGTGDGEVSGRRGLDATRSIQAPSPTSLAAVEAPDNPDLELANVTVSGGETNGAGGGIHLEGITALLTDVTVADNVAEDGGGLFAVMATVHATRLTASENTAADGGGGVAVFLTDAQLLDSTVTGNTATQFGGGIHHVGGELTLRETSVTSNRVADGDGGGDGAGIAAVGGTGDIPSASVDIQRSDISSNAALGDGGGLHLDTTTWLVSRSSVTGNVAGAEAGGNGGGIWSQNPETPLPQVLHASTVSGNTAGAAGGGLWTTTGSGEAEAAGVVFVAGSTIAANQAETAPAVAVGSVTSAPTRVVIGASIVADHDAPACRVWGEADDGILQAGDDGESGNVFEDEGNGASSCAGPSFAEGGTFGPTQFVDDAGLQALTSDHDLTRYHLLAPTSPAIDVVVPEFDEPTPAVTAAEAETDPCVLGSVAELAYPIDADQRLVTRPIDGDGDGEAVCDAGAIEFRGAVAVTATTDGAEPGTPGSVTISRSGPVDAAMQVGLTATGTATGGSDHTPLPATVTIPAGASSATVVVEVLDDTLDEPSETVQVTITRPPGTDPAGGPLSGTVTIVDDDVPAGPESEAIQLGGPTRIDTAVTVSDDQFTAGSGPVVLLATADTYADALSASALAGLLDASLLLTHTDTLPSQTVDEIDRLGSHHVIVLGGTDAVSASVADEVANLVASVERIGGTDRFETATLIFDRIVSELADDGDLPDGGLPILLTEGRHPDPTRGWPDAMSASFVAAAGTMPILLTRGDVLPPVTAATLATDEVASTALIGGTLAISETVETEVRDRVDTVTRVAGDTRYATGVAILDQLAGPLGLDASEVWLATGNEFVDGLVAGPAAARAGAVLLLIDGDDPDGADEVHARLAELAPTRVVYVGGDAAITPAVQAVVATYQP